MKEKGEVIWEYVRPQMPALVMLLFLSAFFTVNSGQFLTGENIRNILRQISSMAILGIGLTFVMIAGQFDISGGAVIALVGVVCARLLVWGFSSGLVMLLGLLLGGLLGLINGLCIARLHVSSFLMTLAMSIMIKGAATAVTGGQTIYGLPADFIFPGSGEILGLSFSVILMLLLYIIFAIILGKTVFGHQVYAVGENGRFAEIAGISSARVTILTFILAGVLYAVVGILSTGWLEAGLSTNGIDLEMKALSALAIGGISMSGGRGNLIGAFLGCIIIGILMNGLNLMNLSPYLADFIRGLVILGALLIEAVRSILEEKGRL